MMTRVGKGDEINEVRRECRERGERRDEPPLFLSQNTKTEINDDYAGLRPSAY